MKKTLTVRAGKDDAIVEIVVWNKNVGDTVKKDEVVAVAKLSKAEVDVESSENGVLIEQCAQAGEIIPRPDDAQGDWDAVVGWIETIETDKVSKIADKIETSESKTEISTTLTESYGPLPEKQLTVSNNDVGFVRASPYVRTVARELNIDLARVNGSGPDGIILPKDLYNASMLLEVSQEHDYVIEALSAVRKQIAKNMELSWRCIPHAATSVRIDFRKLIVARKCAPEDEKKYLRFDVVVVFAIIAMLRDSFKELNACFGCEHLGFEGMKLFSHINLGIAYDHPSGLLVPVFHHIEDNNFDTIVKRFADLSRAMRDGSLRPDMFKDATFTFNNVGAFRKSKDSAEFFASNDVKPLIPPVQRALWPCLRFKTDEK